jgi:OmpA-OmpF porin, OOP family
MEAFMKPVPAHSRYSLHFSVLMLLAVSTSHAVAQDTGWYGALNLGGSTSNLETTSLRQALQAAGRTVANVKADDEDSGWRLTGGYSFNRNFAIEAAYADIGDFVATATLLPNGVQTAEASLRGVSIDFVASLPMSIRTSAFARIGLASIRVNQDFSNNAVGAYFADNTERGVHERYGVGLQYRITDALAARLEAERYRTDSNHVTKDHADLVSLGLVYRFGGRRATVAAPIVETPRAAPAPAAPVKITVAASALFDFDRAELKAAGKAELDRLLSDLKGLTYEVVIITGHTDRIGTRAYNLALSERRANTVRDYLVGAGVSASAITARGVNSDEPITTPQQCQGPVSDALKACLQPDRRVEVEVSGTRAR